MLRSSAPHTISVGVRRPAANAPAPIPAAGRPCCRGPGIASRACSPKRWSAMRTSSTAAPPTSTCRTS
ncbi:MAG: hypothetical protein ACK52I_18925 [Pseudomonadota bacterium]